MQRVAEETGMNTLDMNGVHNSGRPSGHGIPLLVHVYRGGRKCSGHCSSGYSSRSMDTEQEEAFVTCVKRVFDGC